MGFLPLEPGRSCRVAVVALLCWLALPAAAPAEPLSPSDVPLPGSSFQGADGDQDDEGQTVDWEGLQTASRVRHSPDPNAQDTAFEGGSQEGEPGRWALTTDPEGVDPGKNNILDAWGSVERPGAETILHLAFTRAAAEGTTFVTFELNHDGRLWDNGRAHIPCRRTGDLLISYEAKGSDVAVVLQQWVTTSSDAGTGCATEGRLEDFDDFADGEDAQGAVNAAAITARLPGDIDGTIPERRFGEASLNLTRLEDQGFGEECFAFGSVWMHSRSSTSRSSSLQDYVAPRPLMVQTCSASGTKFFDVDADGRRDPEEPGIPRFLIWADYDDDGTFEPGEPFSVTDSAGHYVIHDIRPPGGTYRLRETLLPRNRSRGPVATDWICSYPGPLTPGGTADAPGGRFRCGWGPIDVTATPDAAGRDFGNWFPALLTVEKKLAPAFDPGRFDLLVDERTWVAAAGHGARETHRVPPGTYTVSERPTDTTDPAEYRSSVSCRRDVNRAGRTRAGTVFESLALTAGQRATCTFRNVRPGTPMIAVVKSGPKIATAGDTLRYTFAVTNPGDVPFPAAGVVVSDAACDDPPALVSKEDADGEDGSPGTLDPGDTWTYRCANATAAAGTDCEPTQVDNTGTVTGTTAGGASETDRSESAAILVCPQVPPDPGPSPPDPPGPDGPGDPDQPGPVAPVGPRPPEAGAAGTAGLQARNLPRCISRVPRVDLTGARIARVRIIVDGSLRRTFTPETLQRRAHRRLALRPGRHRIAVRITFQRGTGSPPVTLRQTVRVCLPPPAACRPGPRSADGRATGRAACAARPIGMPVRIR